MPIAHALNNKKVFMGLGPTQGPYILQLCMGPSHFRRGLTLLGPSLFRTLTYMIDNE